MGYVPTGYGSPPRVWGILFRYVETVDGFRFTPTRVGNTARTLRRCNALPVHPHACGEYGGGQTRRYTPNGSPPRVWGILLTVWVRFGKLRFTPTRVGNTICSSNPRTLPRGSPPRVWGIPLRVEHAPHRRRFTPTRVGNTDEPYADVDDYYGSPPRVWGIPVDRLGARRLCRFTPTRVGNTRS